ncbi:hypothetical protein BDV95DRAFT_55952 [Massariosphaeria phaeospora]|uniref:Uncharacterized protein n=1 Tax=Massariosphaeria phaeospora TaxID=100035 RepID=A0A7C8ID81_9PLEO|nr:hypothetical protein BDV95DRAFT_55952 [Massariosphaeria phaeospora]
MSSYLVLGPPVCVSSMSPSSPTSSKRRSQMIQHYRTHQREYLQWRSRQEKHQEEPGYFPPQLRQLRTAWHAKRYQKHGKEMAPKLKAKIFQALKNDPPRANEPETVPDKISRWFRYSDEEEEEYEQCVMAMCNGKVKEADFQYVVCPNGMLLADARQ